MDTPFKNFFKGGKEEVVADDSSNDTPNQEERRVVGRIIKLSKTGYGFISSKDIPFTRVFFHWTSLKQNTLNFADLELGQNVEFTPKKVEGKGVRAIRIEVLTTPPNTEPTEVITDTAVNDVVNEVNF